MEQVAIKAWGNSQGIRIPKDVLDRLQLKVSDTLQMEIEGDLSSLHDRGSLFGADRRNPFSVRR